MERRKFEDSFQDAFKDAEIQPSENVWTNIELDLERAAGDHMKRRLAFFKMLAAASVVFALCVGGIGYYIFSDGESNNSGPLAVETTSKNTDEKKLQGNEDATDSRSQTNDDLNARGESSAAVEGSEVADGTRSPAEQRASKNSSDDSKSLNDIKSNAKSTQPPQVASNREADDQLLNDGDQLRANNAAKSSPSEKLLVDDSNNQNTNDLLIATDNITPGENRVGFERNGQVAERKLPAFYEPEIPELEFPSSTSMADPGALLLARLADEERRYEADEKKQKSSSEKLWTSVGFAAGAFDANNPSISPRPSNSMSLMNSTTIDAASKQSRASGVAYSIGVSMGTRIAERWVLQGGINYLTQSSEYTANSVVVVDNNYQAPRAESLNAFTMKSADFGDQPIVANTFPYNVNNNVRFVSVPLQAGYLLVNKKFGLQLNAGVSTDLFLQNTITPDGGGVAKTTQPRGDDSPYRSLNFSGLMGTEFSYKLGSKYRLSLNPGLRYPFSSVYKSNTGIDATPLTFDVGLRFRYIFH